LTNQIHEKWQKFRNRDSQLRELKKGEDKRATYSEKKNTTTKNLNNHLITERRVNRRRKEYINKINSTENKTK